MTNQVRFLKVFGAEWNEYPYKMIVFMQLLGNKAMVKIEFQRYGRMYDRKRKVLQKNQHEWFNGDMKIQRASEKTTFH